MKLRRNSNVEYIWLLYLIIKPVLAGKGLQILTFTRHARSLSIGGSLSWHEILVYVVIYEDPIHSHLLPNFIIIDIITTNVYCDRGSNPDLLHAMRCDAIAIPNEPPRQWLIHCSLRRNYLLSEDTKKCVIK